MSRSRPGHLPFPPALIRAWIIALMCIASPAAVAQGQGKPGSPDSPPPPTVGPAAASPERRALELEKRAFLAIEKGNLKEAEALLRQQIPIDPGNFVPRYNLACVLSLQRRVDDAVEALTEAIGHGFVDRGVLLRDPQLAAIRGDERVQRLLDHWPTVLERHRDANLKAAEAMFEDAPSRYKTRLDERLRIAVMSAMDPGSTDQAMADVSRLYDWGLLNVFPELADEKAASLDPWCIVILPAPRDFLRWMVATYGRDAVSGFSGIGGSYIHDQKRLVAQDLGATFRHEFFHVLHYRSATRLGQDHPIWIQEGLCSLVEDYELGPDASPASLRPVASWRTNIARRLSTGGRLLPIGQFASIPRDRFTGANPLANYAQARTIFLFILSRGKLKDWYRIYTTDAESGYNADRGGVKAIEAAFEMPIADVDKEYRAWVRGLPQVAEQHRPGRATISVDVEQGDGDGPVIADIPADRRGAPNPARRAGLRRGDIITAIDGKPTRDLNELVRILGEHEPGDTVEVSYRRGATHGTARVTLVPR